MQASRSRLGPKFLCDDRKKCRTLGGKQKRRFDRDHLWEVAPELSQHDPPRLANEVIRPPAVSERVDPILKERVPAQDHQSHFLGAGVDTNDRCWFHARVVEISGVPSRVAAPLVAPCLAESAAQWRSDKADAPRDQPYVRPREGG
jgi:hypothetical protein